MSNTNTASQIKKIFAGIPGRDTTHNNTRGATYNDGSKTDMTAT